MGLAGGDNRRNLEAIALLALFLSFASFSFLNLVTRPVACFPGDIGTAKCPLSAGTHDLTPLGTWVNMPNAVTELMSNTSYRGFIQARNGVTGLFLGLQVGCITPSNTLGATLQLQYANYSETSHSLTSGFANIGTSILVDNSANNPCPGNLEANHAALPNVVSPTPVIFELRIVGSGGGGSGDNPRFSFVDAYLDLSTNAVIYARTNAVTNTGFGYFIYSAYSLISATTFTLSWIATNVTSTTACSSNDICVQGGTSTCLVAIAANIVNCGTVTYPTAFIGTTVVTTGLQGAVGRPFLNIATISLLQAQTVTV